MSERELPVTVVIPVWGAHYAQVLERAVASVRAQAGGVGIVVVDNASEVPVPTLPETTVIRSTDRISAGAARNLGLQGVHTEYVLFLDADDELMEGALETLVTRIDANAGCAAVAMSLLEAPGGRLHRNPRRLVPSLARLPRFFAFATCLWSLYPTQGSAILRTAWVRDSGGYADSSGGEDWPLAVSQAFRGRVVIERTPAVLYHPLDTSLWRLARGTGAVLAGSRLVRDRVRDDPAIPAWARISLPLIALAQVTVIVAVRPVYRAVRALFRRGDR